MTDVPNDTTHVNLRSAMGRALECLYIAVESSVADDVGAKVRAYVSVLEADLDRLAGPVCDNPPCGGKRAIEHTREEFRNQRTQDCNFHHHFELPDPADSYYRQDGSCVYTMINGMPCRRFPNHHMHEMPCSYKPPHPPAPLIEAWLRGCAR